MTKPGANLAKFRDFRGMEAGKSECSSLPSSFHAAGKWRSHGWKFPLSSPSVQTAATCVQMATAFVQMSSQAKEVARVAGSFRTGDGKFSCGQLEIPARVAGGVLPYAFRKFAAWGSAWNGKFAYLCAS